MKNGSLTPFAAALAAAAALLAAPALAQDIKSGQRKALACQACHGLDGLSKLPDAPNLAGQPVGYLERGLRAFRDGTRKHEVMSVVAKTLDDADIRDLAAYYGAIRVEVTLPQ